MKVFIDGFGVVAQSITRKLIENHAIKPSSIFVNTYDLPQNSSYIEFLNNNSLKYSFSSYKDSNFCASVKDFSPDILMSLYGRRIIPSEVLELAKYGTFNLHPSLLPLYKGCFSGVWAIINQETYTGITIHEIANSIDSGNILYQNKVLIGPDETGYSIWHKTASMFISCFDEFFAAYLSGNIISQQMPSGGSYYSRSIPYDGFIDENWSEQKVDSFIRALHFPPFKGALLKRGNAIFEINSLTQFKYLINQ